MDMIRIWRVALHLLLMSLISRYGAVYIKEGRRLNVLTGQNFSLTCVGKGPLIWTHNGNYMTRKEFKNKTAVFEVESPTVETSGSYMCIDKGYYRKYAEITVSVSPYNESFIIFERELNIIEVNNNNKSVTFEATYNSTPNRMFFWFGPKGEEINSVNNKKYLISASEKKITLKIFNLTEDDEGDYIILGTAGNKEAKENFTVLYAAPPVVSLTEEKKYFKYEESYNFNCTVKSYPFANITWMFTNCTNYSNCNKDEIPLKKEEMQEKNVVSNVTLKAFSSGKLYCKACNREGCEKKSLWLIIKETENVVDLYGPKESIEGENVTFQCLAPIFNFTSIKWWRKPINGSDYKEIKHKEGLNFTESYSSFSIKSELNVNNISYMEHSGYYKCETWPMVDTDSSTVINLSIKERIMPSFNYSYEKPHDKHVGNTIQLECVFYGLPKPEIHWFKNGNKLNEKVNNSHTFFKQENQIITITDAKIEDTGIYNCNVTNSAGSIKRDFNINIIQDYLSISGDIKAAASNTKVIVIAVITVFVILSTIVAYLIWRIRKERKSVKMLKADLTTFYEGILLTIDSDLAIDEQANLLPYIKDFEFPKENLKFGKQLASGAFRNVVRAEAVGLRGDENSTTVAVKMVKSHSDITHLKALMTELKILIYVGQHLNILNLLGACTIHLIDKELFLIFEYCHFGNLHSYLRLHQKTFINQVDPITDEIDFTTGSDNSTQSTKKMDPLRLHGEPKVRFDNSTTQLLMLDKTEGSSSRLEHNRNIDTVHQRWSVTYKPNSMEELPILLNTKTLLCWSYQVAMGMEYLANLKVVHGDLAARNILLSENNVVKISDFGLARNLYKNVDCKSGKDYKSIKWMAIESIEDGIYSTKSDVWSFGIMLWEFFTLGNTPYPGMGVDEEFIKKLINGYRMSKPEFSTHDMYRIMQGCWKANPTARPHFTDLVHRIGEKIDDELKKHYMEMNSPHMEHNETIKNNINKFTEIINENSQNHN